MFQVSFVKSFRSALKRTTTKNVVVSQVATSPFRWHSFLTTLKSKSILCKEKKNQIGIVYCCSVTYAARLSKNKLFRAQAAQ